jgi:HAD superfamily hydrolase (TIGR01484 family)
MQPLSRLTLADLRDAPGMVLDVDDTLTRRGVLEVEALEALHRIRAMGRRAILVTGRPIGWAETLAAVLPVELAVGENGAGWAFMRDVQGKRALDRGRFESEAEAQVRSAKSAALLARVRAELPEVRLATDHPLRVCDLAFDVGEAERLSEAEVARLRALATSQGAEVVVSSVHLHAIFGTWNKADGVARAASAVLGVAPDELFSRWIFVGDSGNDAPAFARFARTVGVANVIDHLAALPVPPRFVTTLDRGRGVRELVDRWSLALSCAEASSPPDSPR